jgi:CHASE2 domain-containing sensor protein
MATAYRWVTVFAYFLALVWGFSGAYALAHAGAPHSDVLVIAVTVIGGLVFSGILVLIIQWLIELVFALLARYRYAESNVDDLPTIGGNWTRH